MNFHLALLTLCQGLLMVNNVVFIAINGLVGLALAPVGWMATVPITHSAARPKTFDELAECPGSLKRLGFLRMDVDNLGASIAKSADSLARHSAISRSLDWFFKGYLNTLRQSEQLLHHFDANQAAAFAISRLVHPVRNIC